MEGGGHGRQENRGQEDKRGREICRPAAGWLRRLGVGLVSLCPRGQAGEGRGYEEAEISSVRTGFIPPGPQNWAGPGRERRDERYCYFYIILN